MCAWWLNAVAVGVSRWPVLFCYWTKVLLHERDRHMANNLINWCGNAERIVAVVGMAHMDGIEKLWRLDGGTVLHMGNPDV